MRLAFRRNRPKDSMAGARFFWGVGGRSCHLRTQPGTEVWIHPTFKGGPLRVLSRGVTRSLTVLKLVRRGSRSTTCLSLHHCPYQSFFFFFFLTVIHRAWMNVSRLLSTRISG